MNEALARKILEGSITVAHNLRDGQRGMDWKHGDERIRLDCNFTAEELEALAWWMKNK